MVMTSVIVLLPAFMTRVGILFCIAMTSVIMPTALNPMRMLVEEDQADNVDKQASNTD